MVTRIRLGEIAVEVLRKDVRNIHLSVYPPAGRVRISAPERLSLDTIRVFAISKLGWIRRQQEKLRQQERETPRDYVNRESHYVWGRRCLLKVVEGDQAQGVELTPARMLLRVRPGADTDKRQAILDTWYREQIREVAAPMITKWTEVLGTKVTRVHVQRMKTKWGGCRPKSGSIRLNTDLARKPRECLEYIVVHELAHLLEPTHNARFVALMDRCLPRWRFLRQQLNQLPVRHEDWAY